MKTRDVKRCIVCLKPAVVFTGHLLEYAGQHIDKSVGAGFCKEHEDTDCKNEFGEQGCYGLYRKKYGIQEREI